MLLGRMANKGVSPQLDRLELCMGLFMGIFSDLCSSRIHWGDKA